MPGEPIGTSPGTRGGTTEPARSGGRAGVGGAGPIGATAQPEDDVEHEVRYRVPTSEPFEPETRDGMLVDPYRDGACVPPPTIGSEDVD